MRLSFVFGFRAEVVQGVIREQQVLLGRDSVDSLGRDLGTSVAQNPVGLLEPQCWHLQLWRTRVLLLFTVDKELLWRCCAWGKFYRVCSSLTLLPKWSLLKEWEENSQKTRIPAIFQVLG